MTLEYIERQPGWVATFRPDESGWKPCLLDENPDRPLVLDLSRLSGVVSLRRDRAFRRGLSAGRAQPARAGASGLDFPASPSVGLENFADACKDILPGKGLSHHAVPAM